MDRFHLASRISWSISFILALQLLGCGGGDSSPTEPDDQGPGGQDDPIVETGNVTIQQLTEDLEDVNWSITGPCDTTGVGDATLASMPVGNYTVSWGTVTGRVTPTDETQTLAVGETISFCATYETIPGPTSGFVQIEPGSFTIGSPVDEIGRVSMEEQAEITLTGSYELQATEVTNEQFVALAQWALDRGYCVASTSFIRDALDGSSEILMAMGSDDCAIRFDGSSFQCEVGQEDFPVRFISWIGAISYCDWLSLRAGLPRAYDHRTWECNEFDPYGAFGYRLPTEAEWEYACRAGTTTALPNGDLSDRYYDPNLALIGWYCGNSEGSPQPVAQLVANPWGLYDMHGNVWEFCNDRWGRFEDSIDPVGGYRSIESRARRGGSFDMFASFSRSASRDDVSRDQISSSAGFRPARSTD